MIASQDNNYGLRIMGTLSREATLLLCILLPFSVVSFSLFSLSYSTALVPNAGSNYVYLIVVFIR